MRPIGRLRRPLVSAVAGLASDRAEFTIPVAMP
jgi:hypothetical protein